MKWPSGELGLVAQHARVIWVGQLATMAFGVTDAIVAGRYSNEALATLAIASSIFISIYVSLMSVMQALMPVYAQWHGAGRGQELGEAFRQSIYLALALIALGMALMLNTQPLLALFEVPTKLRPEAAQYLSILAWGLLPTLGFRMFASLSQALGAPRLVMQLQIASLLLKVPLTIWFVFGGAGLPALGVSGCAWASFVVYLLSLGIAIFVLKTNAVYQALNLFEAWHVPDWKRLASFVRLGVPAGLASMIEVTSYALMGLLVARMGVQATAGHQIAASVAAVLFMMPLSLSIASSSRVAYWMGAGQAGKAGALARSAYGLTLGIAFAAASLTVIFALPIAKLYSPQPEVQAIGAALLLLVALYHFADAWQTIGCFLLRCWRISVMPMFIYALSLWGIGLGAGYALAYQGIGSIHAWHSPSAFWWMGAVAMLIAALIFQWRIWKLTKKITQSARQIE